METKTTTTITKSIQYYIISTFFQKMNQSRKTHYHHMTKNSCLMYK